MSGAPQINTNPFQQTWVSDSKTEVISQIMRGKAVVQQIPVYQPAYQFGVPPTQYGHGIGKIPPAPDVPTVAGTPIPNYPYPVTAPPVHYVNRSYAGLVGKAANPPIKTNRKAIYVTAPAIVTTYTGN